MYVCSIKQLLKHPCTNQVIEDVPLVDMDRDEGLELCALDRAQFLCRLSDERVEQIEEVLVRLGHGLAVVLCVLERVGRVPRPHQLNA